MLKNIHPLLNAELLSVLAEMGHGDDLVLVDRNFPARSVANETASRVLIRVDGCTIPDMARAILSVFPLDSFVSQPIDRMEVVDAPDELPRVQREFQAIATAAHGSPIEMESLERLAFYEAARQAYAVVATGEERPYGCFILKKGVIFPDAG